MIKQRAETLTQITMMALHLDLFPLLCVLSLSVTSFVNITHSKAISPIHDASFLNRSSFPQGFVFGTASSAYQVHYKHKFVIFFFVFRIMISLYFGIVSLSINFNHLYLPIWLLFTITVHVFRS